MNPLAKSYRGPFYVIALVLSVAASVLTSEAFVDLGFSWAGPIATALTTLTLLIQQFTPIGDGE
jgi:hypothetical protein